MSVFRSDVLSGSVVLISGGSSGIGLEIALQLGLHGAKVVMMGRRIEPLQEAKVKLEKKGIECRYVSGDVRKLDDCQNTVLQTIQNFGRINILVNCAAGNFLATAEGLSPNGFRTVLEIDTMGVVNLTHAAFPHLKKSAEILGDAVIINISATLHYGATYYQAHSSAAKAAIDSITRSYGLEWGIYKIRTVGIAPGPIDNTAGLEKLKGNMDLEAMKSTLPLGRLGTSNDVAMLAVFLSSKAATFITGETIVVDGGCWLWRPPAAPRNLVESLSRGVEDKSRKAGLANSKSKL